MKIKINNEFKKDVLFWLPVYTGVIFIVLVWYSITHFLIETLHLPIPKLKPTDSVEFVTNLCGTMYIILIGLIIGVVAILNKMVRSIFNYIFTIER